MNRAAIELAVATGVPMDVWLEAGPRAMATGFVVLERLAGKGKHDDDGPDARVMSG